jgi:uncharacterized protein (TIGR00299 family) protein
MNEPNGPVTRMHIHLDPVGGAAGDMFIAAVLDAFPGLREGMEAAIRAAGLPAGIGIELRPHKDHALTGNTFAITEVGPVGHSHHHHTRFADITLQLQAADLSEDVRAAAIGMFTLLAGAEAQVHGMPVNEVSFHELGEWDSIADIVGAAFLACQLQASWSVGPLPLGGGRVATAHGSLPVPAPATALLLEGFECFDDGVAGERVTPTGAVILRYLQANRPRGAAARSLCGGGTGFGSRVLPGMSNVLRLLAFEESAATAHERDRIAEILFEVDDQTPEDLATGLSRLREHPAVRDVLQLPAFGKKNRMAAHIRVLADPAQLERVCDACFEETTTIGLRYQVLDRIKLQRTQVEAEVDGRQVGVKLVQRSSGVTAKPEADDIGSAAGGREAREALRHRASEALDKEALDKGVSS